MRLIEKNARVLFAGVLVLGLCLLGVTDCHGAAPRSRGLSIFLENLTPAARQQATMALQALTPVGVEAVEREMEALAQFNPQLAQTNAMLRQFNFPGVPLLPDDARVLYAQGCVDILRFLPRDQQQQFMNGVFGVSLAERQFAEQLIIERWKAQQKFLEQLQRR